MGLEISPHKRASRYQSVSGGVTRRFLTREVIRTARYFSHTKLLMPICSHGKSARWAGSAGTHCRNPSQSEECFSIAIRTSWLRVHPAPRPNRIPMRTNYGLTLNSTLAQFPVRVLQCEFGFLLNPRSGAIVNVPLPFPSITSNVGSSSSP
jgi:hypothetical protein